MNSSGLGACLENSAKAVGIDTSICRQYGAVAQLVARLIWDQEATSSSLVGSTSCRVAPG